MWAIKPAKEFTQTYRLPALLNVESYLLKYDLPNLPLAVQARLKGWLAGPGVALAGLDGIPIAGYGELSWLYARQRADPQDFLKPSPLHALTVLRLALGETQETALTSAFDLIPGGRMPPGGSWTTPGYAFSKTTQADRQPAFGLPVVGANRHPGGNRIFWDRTEPAQNPVFADKRCTVLPTLVAARREKLTRRIET